MKLDPDYDPGPYYTAEEATTAARHGILGTALAESQSYLRIRRETILTMVLARAGVEETDYETECLRAIARTVEPEHAQVIAGWITRAYYAGQLTFLAQDANNSTGGTQ